MYRLFNVYLKVEWDPCKYMNDKCLMADESQESVEGGVGKME